MSTNELPTLGDVYNAVLDFMDTEKIQSIRRQFGWTMDNCIKSTAENKTSDAAYNRLQFLHTNFGPECLKCKDKGGNTLLHLTARDCETEAAMELIFAWKGGEDDGLDCLRTERNDSGWNAIHFAAANSNIVALKWLVEKLGPNCLKTITLDKRTPQHIAAATQATADAVKFIIREAGPSCLYLRDSQNRTAFHSAATNKSGKAVLDWLMGEVGPEFITAKDQGGITPVHLAAANQDVAFMEMVKPILGDLLFTLRDENGMLLVHFAAMNPDDSVLSWCVKEMGPVCLLAKSQTGQLPVHLAAQFQTERSLDAIVHALGDSGCLATPDKAGRTVAHYAAMNERSNSALRWVVAKLGTDCMTQPDAEGSMPIHLAASHQGTDSLEFIRDRLGSQAFLLAGKDGQTMVHYSMREKSMRAFLPLYKWLMRNVGPQCMQMPDGCDVGIVIQTDLPHL